MSRLSRKSLNSKCFHVIVQGIEKKYIFEEYKYKEKYKKLLNEKLIRYNIKILAFCIMDNHAHMLIYTEKISELSEYMQKVNTSFARYYNKTNDRVGYVFRDRFLSEPIRSQEQLYRTLSYIHLNPVAAEMCKFPELYLFSSYNDYLEFKGIADDTALKLLNFDKQSYIERFKFMHYMRIEGIEFDRNRKKIDINETIGNYIKENKIVDIIFQADKVKKMINELKKQKISFSKIASFLNVTNKQLKDIISS